jgi:hypothetical protein
MSAYTVSRALWFFGGYIIGAVVVGIILHLRRNP